MLASTSMPVFERARSLKFLADQRFMSLLLDMQTNAHSVLDYFLMNVRDFGFRTAALVKKEGRYTEVTWAQLGAQVDKLAMGIAALGITPGDRICILSQTRLEWVAIDLAILSVGCVTVPIYHSSLADECQYITSDSEATLVFAEDASQVNKFLNERQQLGKVKKIIQMSGSVGTDPWVMSLESLLANGVEVPKPDLTPDSILTIIYTSGTTGRPKGVVATHGALLYEAEAIASIRIILESDIQLFFLPLAHVLAKIIEISWLRTRHTLAFAEGIPTIKDNLLEVRPTLMAGVPRIFEKFYAAVVHKGLAQKGVKGMLFAQALAISEKHGEAEYNGQKLSIKDQVRYKIFKTLVFKKVSGLLKTALGGRMRLMVSGSAPLSRKVAYFFRDANCNLIEGYGLTETSAATCVNPVNAPKIGSVGIPIPGTEVRIAEDGEILVRGPGVMREYWKHPAETAEILADGWLHTGDIGHLDKDNYLFITDRKKDIIATAGGKKVPPQNIENMLKTHTLISNAVVYGDKRKFLSALITLDAEVLRKWVQRNGIQDASYAELTQRPEVEKAVQAIVEAVNRDLAQYETIKKFKILEHDFSTETGELTPTLKLKRKVINERYKSIFDSFYEAEF
jgi:long-chain acyl-CoA synthetase